jgi:diguanylate cyclase
MGLVGKLIGNSKDSVTDDLPDANAGSLADDALDTLGCIIRKMGDESFPLDGDNDPAAFPRTCHDFAAHVENGAAVPAYDIEPSIGGAREWGKLRHFYIGRREGEKRFVSERLRDYRGFVEDLVGSLKQIGDRDQRLELSVIENLERIESAIDSGALPEIKASLGETVRRISESFADQKAEYENQISELNDRMSNLRQDLVAVREEMKRDPLTDAFNRGAFDTSIAQSLNMHFVLNQPVTLILIDIDKFKDINDSYGHAAGDHVLRAISDSLARTFIRKSDLVARFGGDEFAVILNDTDAGHAGTLIQRFMQSIATVEIPHAPEGAQVTCSIGFAEIGKGDTVESLLEHADKALYEAKAAGRNAARMAERTAA